jgi:hypothetical protein
MLPSGVSRDLEMDERGRVVVHESECITVWHWPDHGLVHHRMHRVTRGAALRDALAAGAEILERAGADKWLSDDRLNGATPAADVEWSRAEWLPRVSATGWKYWAVVRPAKVLGQMHMKTFVDDFAARGLTAQMFSDDRDAWRWITAFVGR